MTTSATEPASPTRPYGPSWVNLVIAWFESLPGPTWVAYVGAIVIALGLSGLLMGDATPVGGAFTIVYYGALPFGVFGLIHILDRTAGRALDSLRPLLAADDAAIAAMHYQLTVAPARPAALVALVVFGFTAVSLALDPVGSGIASMAPQGVLFRYLWESLITSVFLILVYHTFRQLRLIDRIHAEIERIDVFDQGPLYAFSQLTSRTALGLILLLAPSLFLLPTSAGASTIIITSAWYAFAVLVAGAAFVLPLRGMHDRLVTEKRRLQGEVGRRLTATVDAIHTAVDAEDGGAIEARNRALSTLIAERDLVNRIPTWPWSGGALTGFASAIVLPIILFLVQRFLSQLV